MPRYCRWGGTAAFADDGASSSASGFDRAIALPAAAAAVVAPAGRTTAGNLAAAAAAGAGTADAADVADVGPVAATGTGMTSAVATIPAGVVVVVDDDDDKVRIDLI